MSKELKPNYGPRLIIDQGEILLTEGHLSCLLLSNWQDQHDIADGTPVRVLTQEHFLDLCARAAMAGIA